MLVNGLKREAEVKEGKTKLERYEDEERTKGGTEEERVTEGGRLLGEGMRERGRKERG